MTDCAWAVAGQGEGAEEREQRRGGERRARSGRGRAARAPRPADRPAADTAYIQGEERPPRRGGRRSGGDGGSACSRARGAVMDSALGARRSALGALNQGRTDNFQPLRTIRYHCRSRFALRNVSRFHGIPLTETNHTGLSRGCKYRCFRLLDKNNYITELSHLPLGTPFELYPQGQYGTSV